MGLTMNYKKNKGKIIFQIENHRNNYQLQSENYNDGEGDNGN